MVSERGLLGGSMLLALPIPATTAGTPSRLSCAFHVDYYRLVRRTCLKGLRTPLNTAHGVERITNHARVIAPSPQNKQNIAAQSEIRAYRAEFGTILRHRVPSRGDHQLGSNVIRSTSVCFIEAATRSQLQAKLQAKLLAKCALHPRAASITTTLSATADATQTSRTKQKCRAFPQC